MRSTRHIAKSGIAFSLALLLAVTWASSARAFEKLQSGEKLTLARAIQLTLRNHPRRLQMESQAVAAQERVGEAKSELLPQIYGAADYLRSTDNAIGNTTYLNPGFVPRITGTLHGGAPNEGQSFATSNNFLAGIGAQQYLFDFGRVRGQIRERGQEAQAAQYEAKMASLDLTFETTQRYFALLAAQQKEKVYKKAVAQRLEQLQDAKVKTAANLTSQIDVLTAEAALARARTNLLEAANEKATARVALGRTMAESPHAPPYRLADVLTYNPVRGNVESYFSSALEVRPDLEMLKAEARAAGAQVNIARSNFFPSAQAVAGYNAMGTGLPAANNFNVGLVVSWPIFNGFQAEHQVDEAKARENAVQYAIRDLELRVWLEVKSSFLNLQTALQQIHSAETTLAASSSQLELAEKRYDAGLGNIIELTDAERFYIEDDAAYIDALYSYSVAKAALDHATGSSLPSRSDS